MVQETANKVYQTIRCWWHVRGWGGVGPDTRKSFRWVSRGKMSAISIVILLHLLHEMIWFDRYVENKVLHTGAKLYAWAGTGSATLSSPYICTYGTCGACGVRKRCVSQSEEKLNIAYRWRVRVVVHCIVIVIGCVVVWWVVHFALHEYISHWLRVALPVDASLVVISHMRVLKCDSSDTHS